MKPKDTRRDFLKFAGIGVTGAAMTVPSSAQISAPTPAPSSSGFLVTSYGATGDGKTIDTPAVNRAIEAAAVKGGTVIFPAGTYACFSIHLKSNVALYLEQGATVLAAEGTQYDPAEPNTAWDAYQDYGHNHWHNSLLWGENLENISITGPGLIHGKGLSKGYGPGPDTKAPGIGNKAISLKNCRNVILRDFSILQGGWFGILATGVDNLTIDNLKIDTNRDGMDIDCCRNVRVSNCAVNSPWDDGICLKSSYGLGYARATENVTITNCYVSGYWELGSMLDGSWKKFPPQEKVSRTGRIKFGTESNGGFINITVSNCVFEGCQGLALESDDGALLEDIAISNITMRHIVSAPIFVRLGSRLRGPKETTKVGTMRRIFINNIVCWNNSSRFAAILSGIPGYNIEDVSISDILIAPEAGATAEQAALELPEVEAKYPEPNMFGPIPASGFYIRHLRGLSLSNIHIKPLGDDPRPAIVLEDVQDADLFRIKAKPAGGAPILKLHQVENLEVRFSRPIPDTNLPHVDSATLPQS
jgi:polygalacturonase